MLLKKHELESVCTIFENKKKQLEERKMQLHSILFGDNKQNDVITSQYDGCLDSEIIIENISWGHPIERMKQIWNLIDHITTKRNLLTNFVFESALTISTCGFVVCVGHMLLEREIGEEFLIAGFFFLLYAWGVLKILMNERQGFWLCILPPFIASPVIGIVGWQWRQHETWLSYVDLGEFISLLMAPILVLSLLFLRKNKKSAWNLMTGSWKDLVNWRDKITLSVFCIILVITFICYCLQG